MPISSRALSAVSLFSGAGGVDIGFANAGFETQLANDIDKDACATYARNHSNKIICSPILDILPVLAQYSGADCVYGGPPCQGFSVAGKMKVDDPRNQLVWDFLSSVAVVKPKAFVMENVAALKRLAKFRGVYDSIYLRAEQMGYHLVDVTLNAEHYGVPQRRERVFFFGSTSPIDEVKLRDHFQRMSRHRVSVKEALTPLGKAGSVNNEDECIAKITPCKNPVLRASAYAGMLFNGAGRPINPDGASPTITATTGGNRTPIIDQAHLFDGAASAIEIYHRHLMKGGKVKTFEEIGGDLHRLTLQQGARLQTFPPEYAFVGKASSVWRQIGNAIPAELAFAVATAAKALCEGKLSK